MSRGLKNCLEKLRFYGEELSGPGKARKEPCDPKVTQDRGAKADFNPALSDSQKSSSWGPMARSCLLTNGPVLLLSDMEQLIYLFLLI